jgi:hypothetical protein
VKELATLRGVGTDDIKKEMRGVPEILATRAGDWATQVRWLREQLDQYMAGLIMEGEPVAAAAN